MSTADKNYKRGDTSWTRPGVSLVAVTKSDATVYDPPLRGFYVGGAGDVAVIAADDTAAVTLTGCLAGVLYPFSVTKVMSTNTTATAIVGVR